MDGVAAVTCETPVTEGGGGGSVIGIMAGIGDMAWVVGKPTSASCRGDVGPTCGKNDGGDIENDGDADKDDGDVETTASSCNGDGCDSCDDC